MIIRLSRFLCFCLAPRFWKKPFEFKVLHLGPPSLHHRYWQKDSARHGPSRLQGSPEPTRRLGPVPGRWGRQFCPVEGVRRLPGGVPGGASSREGRERNPLRSCDGRFRHGLGHAPPDFHLSFCLPSFSSCVAVPTARRHAQVGRRRGPAPARRWLPQDQDCVSHDPNGSSHERFNLWINQQIHALISSRLDYCNALYVGVSQTSLSRLQLVQNAAARLLSNTNRRMHITLFLNSLHWLPVLYRIDFKLLFKCLFLKLLTASPHHIYLSF